MLDIHTLNLVSGSMNLIQVLAWHLAERADEHCKPLLNEILGLMHSTIPVFERVSLAFDEGRDVEDEDLQLVRTVLMVRITLEDAFARVADEHLDWYASVVDDGLKPFENALFMLDVDGHDLDRCFENTFIDPEAWFGVFVRPELETARILVEIAFDRIREASTIERLSMVHGVTPERVKWCLDLSDQHLRNLYWKWSREDRNGHLVARDRELDTNAVWTSHGHPLHHRVVEVAVRMLRTSDEKLKRFEERLRYLY